MGEPSMKKRKWMRYIKVNLDKIRESEQTCMVTSKVTKKRVSQVEKDETIIN